MQHCDDEGQGYYLPSPYVSLPYVQQSITGLSDETIDSAWLMVVLINTPVNRDLLFILYIFLRNRVWKRNCITLIFCVKHKLLCVKHKLRFVVVVTHLWPVPRACVWHTHLRLWGWFEGGQVRRTVSLSSGRCGSVVICLAIISNWHT